MTLSTLSQELHVARSKRYALAGLVILGWEDAKYYVKAAEEINCPIILQVGPHCRENTPIEIMGPMLTTLAKAASINGTMANPKIQSSFAKPLIEYSSYPNGSAITMDFELLTTTFLIVHRLAPKSMQKTSLLFSSH